MTVVTARKIRLICEGKNMRRFLVALLAIIVASPASSRPNACTAFDNSVIIAKDGSYMGKLSSKFDGDSIFNKFGQYGSKFSGKSIWNRFSNYGSQFSDVSPFNKFASKPPLIVSDGTVIGVLTVNELAPGAINPMVLAVSCYDYTPE